MFQKLRIYTFMLEFDNADQFHGTVYTVTEGRLKSNWETSNVWISEQALEDNFRRLSP